MLLRILLVSSILTVSPLLSQPVAPKPLIATIRTDFFPRNADRVDTRLTIQFDRDALQFRQDQGIEEALINLTVRVTTPDGRPAGRAIEQFIAVRGPETQLAALQTGVILFNTSIALESGSYTLFVAYKDVVRNVTQTVSQTLDVPASRAGALSTSSLVLADVMEKVPARFAGQGQFIIGANKVRPRINQTFQRSETLGIYLEVNNLQMGSLTQAPDGSVTYEISRTGSGERVLDFTEDASTPDSHLTIAKKLRLDTLAPGDYTLRVLIKDSIRNETTSPSAAFRVI